MILGGVRLRQPVRNALAAQTALSSRASAIRSNRFLGSSAIPATRLRYATIVINVSQYIVAPGPKRRQPNRRRPNQKRPKPEPPRADSRSTRFATAARVCLLRGVGVVGSPSGAPQVDGSVVVPGLSSKVRVVRDEQGVPTIEAATLEDLFFAQGYVTAQDRLWQMEMMRRAAAGELSEVIGEATLKIDRAAADSGLARGRRSGGKKRNWTRSRLSRRLRARRECVHRIAPRPAAAGVPGDVRAIESVLSSALSERSRRRVIISSLDDHRFAAGGREHGSGVEPLQLFAGADARKDSGETRAGVDGRSVCEFFLARSSAD